MRALLLALSALAAVCWAESQVVTRCTARACFTLHEERAPFDVAVARCEYKGGHLLTVRDKEEEEDVRALLTLAGATRPSMLVKPSLWIGLKLDKASCVLGGERLYGFHWVSGAADSGELARWGREPQSTCTEERCVWLNASAARLDWHDGSCKQLALYACRFQFKGMCKALVLSGLGSVTYTLPFSPDAPLKEDFAMVPHATLAEISCTSTLERFYPICIEADGAGVFIWTETGPFCAAGERSCARQNGGCEQVCLEGDAGGVVCTCRDGFYLGEDGVTCLPEDACRKASCEHECVTEGAGFQCVCRQGFQLAGDLLACVDVDECERHVCGDHLCHNNPGSYDCECRRGFRKDAAGACEDVDECAEGACGRRASCLNSQGSFSCYCGSGFRTASSGRECVDVDECLIRPCEDVCTNTEGSYVCSCRAGFRLAENGISCVEPTPDTPAASEAASDAPQEESSTVTAVTPLLSIRPEAAGKEGGLDRWWVLVWVLGSLIPLLLLVALTSLVVVLRWKRSRRDAKKKSATADSYCWVSSGFQIQSDTDARPHK